MFRRLYRLFTLIIILLVTGFIIFLIKLDWQPHSLKPVDIQGIVVLTGDTGRIPYLLSLIENGFSGPVLISGANPTVSLEDILGETILTTEQMEAITLDNRSQTTRENVLETKLWAHEHQLTQIGLITSHYHMPRSLRLFKELAKNLTLTPLPVIREDIPQEFYVREYLKFLIAPRLP